MTQLPDFWKGIALHRIAAMMRSGGVLRLRDMVYDVTPAQAPQALEEWMAGAVSHRRRRRSWPSVRRLHLHPAVTTGTHDEHRSCRG